MVLKDASASKNIAKGMTDLRHFDSFSTFSSEQKLQQAFKSWSNFSLVLFGKREEIDRTTLTNPFSNLNRSV